MVSFGSCQAKQQDQVLFSVGRDKQFRPLVYIKLAKTKGMNEVFHKTKWESIHETGQNTDWVI